MENQTVVTMFDLETESRQILRSDDFTYKDDPPKTSNKIQIFSAMICFAKQILFHTWIRMQDVYTVIIHVWKNQIKDNYREIEIKKFSIAYESAR